MFTTEKRLAQVNYLSIIKPVIYNTVSVTIHTKYNT